MRQWKWLPVLEFGGLEIYLPPFPAIFWRGDVVGVIFPSPAPALISPSSPFPLHHCRSPYHLVAWACGHSSPWPLILPPAEKAVDGRWRQKTISRYCPFKRFTNSGSVISGNTWQLRNRPIMTIRSVGSFNSIRYIYKSIYTVKKG